jgi:glycosyltransferase involved in cell wall biosynthesis
LHDLFASCPRYHRVRADDSFCELDPGVASCLNCAPRWKFQGDAEIAASLDMFVDDLRGEVEAAAALVAPTAGHGQRIMNWLGLDRAIHAIPPAGSTAGATATCPLGDRVATPTDPLRVGVFGHLHPLKGVEVLLDAHAVLADPRLIQVHVWGEAPDEAMGATVRARAGDRPVVWHGAYRPEDLAGAQVDAVVLPTLCAESYSFTLDEAASLGVPILATDLGALADRATGRVGLFGRGDVAALASALSCLATDPSARATMRAAPAPATQGATAHDEALRSVYREVLSRPRPAVSPDPSAARARRAHAFDLREAGLAELLRSEGWENVIAGLQAELDRLRGQPGS